MRNFLALAILVTTPCFVLIANAKTEDLTKNKCEDELVSSPEKPFITREEVRLINEGLRHPHEPGHYGVRILSDEAEETPDPDRPILFPMPDGKKKYVIGYSGQKAMFIDDLREFFQGGIHRTQPIHLYNKNGYQYGVELEINGKRIHYAHNSSLWDIYAVHYRKDDGSVGIRVFAGGMSDYAHGEKAGQPLLPVDGFRTRQRLFFDGVFEWNGNPADPHYTLIGKNPSAVLNRLQPDPREWISTDETGVGFNHGYGGGPITLANGDLYLTKEGWVAFVHESVLEQKNMRHDDGSVTILPSLTVQSVTFLDREMKKIVAPTRTIWSPVRSDGSVYKAALRREWAGSPLTEGLHLTPMANGRVIESFEDLMNARKSKATIEFQGLNSHGEYYGEYGGHAVDFDENFMNPKPYLDDHGELEDFLAPLQPIFAWRGRPCSVFVEGEEFVMAHSVDRSRIPPGLAMNRMPSSPEAWVKFNRQAIGFPIERYRDARGGRHIRIKDNTGLLERLSRIRSPEQWP